MAAPAPGRGGSLPRASRRRCSPRRPFARAVSGAPRALLPPPIAPSQVGDVARASQYGPLPSAEAITGAAGEHQVAPVLRVPEPAGVCHFVGEYARPGPGQRGDVDRDVVGKYAEGATSLPDDVADDEGGDGRPIAK